MNFLRWIWSEVKWWNHIIETLKTKISKNRRNTTGRFGVERVVFLWTMWGHLSPGAATGRSRIISGTYRAIENWKTLIGITWEFPEGKFTCPEGVVGYWNGTGSVRGLPLHPYHPPHTPHTHFHPPNPGRIALERKVNVNAFEKRGCSNVAEVLT